MPAAAHCGAERSPASPTVRRMPQLSLDEIETTTHSCLVHHGAKDGVASQVAHAAVSYTRLTLPTIDTV